MLVDFRGKTACRVGHAAMQFSHTHMEAGVWSPCSLTAQGAAGILMGVTQMTSYSAVNWKPSVMGVAKGSCLLLKKHQGVWDCPYCNGENIAVVNYHIDEKCFGENQESRVAQSAEKERGCCNCKSNCNNMQSSNQYLH